MGAPRPLGFATLLRHHRLNVGMTQEELAERSNLSERTVSDLERGITRYPHRDTVHRLAEALSLSPGELHEFEQVSHRPSPANRDSTEGAPRTEEAASEPSRWRRSPIFAYRLPATLVMGMGATLCALAAVAWIGRSSGDRSVPYRFPASFHLADKWGAVENTSRRFHYLGGVSLDRAGVMYVTDSSPSLVQILSPQGAPITQWKIGTAGTGHIASPGAVGVDPRGNVYVADAKSADVEEYAASGDRLRQWAVAASGIAIDSIGNVFLADPGDGLIVRYSSRGDRLAAWRMSTIDPLQSGSPSAIAVDHHDHVYVLDSAGLRVLEVSANGRLMRQWSMARAGSQLPSDPNGLAVAGDGTIYISDAGSGAHLWRVAPGQRNAVIWPAHQSALSGLLHPSGIAVDALGRLDVADSGTNRITQISPTGQVLHNWEKAGAQAVSFNDPQQISVDQQGDVYVADYGNSRIVKSSPSGRILALWKIPGIRPGVAGNPMGIAATNSGRLYVSDWFNDALYTLSSTGRVLARVTVPDIGDLSVNRDGFLYVASHSGNRIIELSSTGRHIDHWNLDGPISGVAVDRSGRGYAVRYMTNTVWRLDPHGRQERLPLLRGKAVTISSDPLGNVYVWDVVDDIVRLPTAGSPAQWTHIQGEITAQPNPHFVFDTRGRLLVATDSIDVFVAAT